jgi:site-specific recombinase XerD
LLRFWLLVSLDRVRLAKTEALIGRVAKCKSATTGAMKSAYTTWKVSCNPLKHSIATHLLDAGADLAFVKDWLGHANIQNTTIYARLTTATLDSTARKVFASHRVV